MPSYFERFACIGGACEDHCCKEWDIYIDRKTFQRYRNIKDPAFVKAFPDRIKRVRGDLASDVNYARFPLDENRNCRFFTGDGLCEIQRDYGPDYLCATCRTYPRRQMKQVVDGIYEASMYMTCPELVRIALFPADPITFQMNDAAEFLEHNAIVKTVTAVPAQGMGQYAWQVREGCIDILQWRGISIANRLLAIGMLLSKLVELEGQDALHHVPGTVALYVAAVQEGQYSDALDSIPRNPEIETVMGLILTQVILTHCGDPARKNEPFRQFLNTMAQEAGFDESGGKLTFADLHTVVEKRAETAWPKFLEEKGHVLENFFVNYMFSAVFPFTFQELDIYHHFVLLAEQYALLRMLVCTTADNVAGISDAALIQLVKTMSTNLEHNQEARHITEAYQKAGLDSLAHISFLLRD